VALRLRVYTATVRVVLICVLLLFTSCVMIPIPTTETKVLAGTPVTEEHLGFLTPKITTKRDVIDRLGNPNIIWEDLRVFVYNWEVRQGILLWAAGGHYAAVGGIEDIPKHYLLLIQFDEHDRLHRFERTVRPLLQSYADFLKEWAANPNDRLPQDRPAQGK